jgi:hypothetical protein
MGIWFYSFSDGQSDRAILSTSRLTLFDVLGRHLDGGIHLGIPNGCVAAFF